MEIAILMIITDLLAWMICHMLCEYKYFWCKGKCHDCNNWQCAYFECAKICKTDYKDAV